VVWVYKRRRSTAEYWWENLLQSYSLKDQEEDRITALREILEAWDMWMKLAQESCLVVVGHWY
jgi:hypothetical protein